MLFSAIRENDIRGVLELLNHGGYVDVNSKLANGLTPLMMAVERSTFNDALMVRALLTSPDVDVNMQDNRGFTALMMAVEDDKLEAVEALLADFRVNVNIRNNEGLAALSLAKSVDIANALLADARVDVNITNPYGWTPLMVALRAERLPIVKLLLENRRVNIDARDHNDLSALQLALDMGNNEAIRLFLARIQFREIQNRQLSPLMSEAQKSLWKRQ